MATALTYTSLLSDLRAYLDRGQSAAVDPIVYEQLPRLVNQAERRIAYELQIEGMQQVVQSTLTSGAATMAKPDRWRRTISINIGTGTDLNTRVPVFPRSYEFVRAFTPDDTVTGQPRYYGDYDYDHWIFAPTPDAAYPIEVLYYGPPPLLDDSNQTNWLTELAPNLLLYAALGECAPFLKDDERIPTWEGKYRQMLDAMSTNDVKKIVDRSSTRQGQ